jgi:hypothetical protein
MSWWPVGDCWSLPAVGRGRRVAGRPLTVYQSPGLGRPGVDGHRPLLHRSPFWYSLAAFFLPLASKNLHMWSTLPHWLQHMPALPRLLLETSNIHNLWSVGAKNAFCFFLQSLLWDACSQKVSKNLKVVCAQVTQTKTGLSTVRTFSPLGVNLVPTLGRVKSSNPHRMWRFYFFSNFFAKIRIHQDLHMHHLKFCLLRKVKSQKTPHELLV